MATIHKERIIQDAQTSAPKFSYNVKGVKSVGKNEQYDHKGIVALIRNGYSKYCVPTYKNIFDLGFCLYENGDKRAKGQLKTAKEFLPYFQPAGFNPFGHAVEGLQPNGFVQLDIDFHFKGGFEKAKRLKPLIAQLPYVSMCFLSPTFGLKVIIKTDIAPEAMTPQLYTFAQNQLIKEFNQKLDIDSKYFDNLSIAQPCYLPHDRTIFDNEFCAAYQVDLSEFEALQTRAKHKPVSIIGDDVASAAAKYLIENQINVANCRSEYLSFLAACKNAFGEEGKGIAYEILSFSDNFHVSEFRSKFDSNFESLKRQSGNVADKGTILYFAKQNGFFYYAPLSTAPIDDFKPRLIVSEKPQVTFIELVNADMNAAYYETAQKVTRQIKNQNFIAKSEFVPDANKTLYVLFDRNIKELPEYFKGFKETVFIMGSESKRVQDMSDFVREQDVLTNGFLAMVRTEKGTYIEKAFFETIKKMELPVKKENGVWIKCDETAAKLEDEHHVKVLANSQSKMATYLKKYIDLEVETTDLSDESATIQQSIKETGVQLTKEKKQEFKEFFESVESIENFDLEAFNALPYATLERGGKIAYKRIRTLLKLRVDFNTALEAVKDSYQTWVRTKGQFLTSKIMDTNTKNAKKLNTFKSEVEGQLLTKQEILDRLFELDYISKNEKKAWNEVKRMFAITSKKARNGKQLTYLYEVYFI
jgi:VirE N-terminal domain